jgi:hypothetical protein
MSNHLSASNCRGKTNCISIGAVGVRNAYGTGRRGPFGRRSEGMTSAVDSRDLTPLLDASIHIVQGVISSAGCGVPAAVLNDAGLAAWVRAHGVTVIAHDDSDLNMSRDSGIRPAQIVFRCGTTTDSIHRAVSLGVSRFTLHTERQLLHLGRCTQRTKYVYLDDRSPLVLGDHHLKVVGLHGDVDDTGDAVEWASVAERLLCRTALLKTCGSPVERIMLSGGSTELWLNDPASQLSSIVRAVDDALREGCERWQLPRPTVTFAPLMVADIMAVAA